jgi:1-acyl-sn-glycerol-3-phosphate acyltransferase
VRKGRLGFWMRLAEFIVRPLLFLMTRHDGRGQENIPAEGPAILVVSHISYADPLTVAKFILDRPRDLRFLVKASLFEIPFVGLILRKVGQIPVYRETKDAGRALEAAVAAVGAGDAVVIYPEGTCTKDPDLWPMRGKTGAARLALLTGAPVIPIVQWGAQRIHHPITGKVRLVPRTPITVAAGPPVDLSAFAGADPTSGEVLKQMTDVIMRRLRDDVAVLRGEPAPTGPLFVPPARTGPQSTEVSP